MHNVLPVALVRFVFWDYFLFFCALDQFGSTPKEGGSSVDRIRQTYRRHKTRIGGGRTEDCPSNGTIGRTTQHRHDNHEVIAEIRPERAASDRMYSAIANIPFAVHTLLIACIAALAIERTQPGDSSPCTTPAPKADLDIPRKRNFCIGPGPHVR